MNRDKLKKGILIFGGFGLASAAILALMVSIFIGGDRHTEAGDSVTQTVPDGHIGSDPDSKSEAYSAATSGLRGRKDALDEYFGNLPEAEEDISLVSGGANDTGVRGAGTHAGNDNGRQGNASGDAASRVFGAAPDDTAPNASTSSRTARSSAASLAGASRGRISLSSMTPEERMEYDRQRAEMVRDIVTGGAAAGSAVKDSSARETSSSKKDAEPLDFSGYSSDDDIISSLDDDFSDSSVRYAADSKRPFRCMFIRNEHLKDGQRVTLRLLEEYRQDGVRIPANSHLQAHCKIGERLTLSVRSVEMGGRIIPLMLDAYDADGLPGIYCPEASKAAKTIESEGINTATNAFGGLVGNIAGGIIRTGASIARNTIGEKSVTVNSGYEFYLVKTERK